MKNRIIIVGAGPAGMMAAGQAALSGAEVLVLEKMGRTLLKLGITGKGRCNITNVAEIPEFISHFGTNGRFLRQAFHRFFSPELLKLLQQAGVTTTTERGGRVFPTSGKALQVVQALRRWAEKSGVEIKSTTAVDALLTDANGVSGVRCAGVDYAAAAVILATGGASYTATGSTGEGYRLAREVGHSIVDVRPALVPLLTASTGAVARLQTLTLRNVGVQLYVEGKKHSEAFGELTFIPKCVSGPVILTLSLAAVDAVRAGQKVSIEIDLKPALDDKKLDARLLRDFEKRAHEPMHSILRGLIPRELVEVCLECTRVSHARLGHSVSAQERMNLLHWLKHFTIDIGGHAPMDEAIVSAGGIDLNEVNPRTMESKLVPGLYFAGEVLDLQADTGGYNLQAAFSTGWLAGTSAAEAQQTEF
ncbi:MAG: NAD(P)/FAD-dependent oxidoreductase [Desulfuromonas sp.]|nr:NAD(P)/FAD-dependent oxidoreductase [Desulfuromonas sp.]